MTAVTDSMGDLVYYYDPTPAREPSPAELWWASLKEGDEIPMYDSDGERIGTATVGPRIERESIPFQISTNPHGETP